MGGCLTPVRLWGDEGVRISRLNTGLGGHNLHKTERIHNFNWCQFKIINITGN
jgi:hypothetical protein